MNVAGFTDSKFFKITGWILFICLLPFLFSLIASFIMAIPSIMMFFFSLVAWFVFLYYITIAFLFMGGYVFAFVIFVIGTFKQIFTGKDW